MKKSCNSVSNYVELGRFGKIEEKELEYHEYRGMRLYEVLTRIIPKIAAQGGRVAMFNQLCLTHEFRTVRAVYSRLWL